MKKLVNTAAGLGLVLTAALAFGLTSGCELKQADSEEITEAAISVQAEPPRFRDMTEVIEVHGNLEPYKQAEVVAEVSGAVVKINVDEGDVVSAGDVLARIDDEEYLLSYNQSKAAFQVASSDYKSAKELYDQGMKSKSEYEKMKRSYVDAKSNLEMAKIRLKNTELKSPIGGVVLSRNCDLYRQAGTMESLFRVGDLSRFIVDITVTEAEVARLKIGQKVKVRIDAVVRDPDEFPFTGTVDKIQPAVDPQTGTVEVEIGMADPGMGVRPGMFARLKIVTDVHENAMVIPRKAISSDDENVVWVVDGDGAKTVDVKLGLIDKDDIEVLSGLTPDDLVIVAGQSALTADSTIDIVNAEGRDDSSVSSRESAGK